MSNFHSTRAFSRKAASLVAIALALAVAGPVHAAETGAAESVSKAGLKDYPTRVRFDWKAEARTVTVTFDTGCRSAHRSAPLEEAFEVYLDRDYLQFDIQGGYKVKPQADPASGEQPRVGSADCMGSLSRSIELHDVEPETYVVNRHGDLFETVTLGDEDVSFIIPARDRTKSVNPVRKNPAMFLQAE
jgi:hypothetical protein